MDERPDVPSGEIWRCGSCAFTGPWGQMYAHTSGLGHGTPTRVTSAAAPASIPGGLVERAEDSWSAWIPAGRVQHVDGGPAPRARVQPTAPAAHRPSLARFRWRLGRLAWLADIRAWDTLPDGTTRLFEWLVWLPAGDALRATASERAPVSPSTEHRP